MNLSVRFSELPCRCPRLFAPVLLLLSLLLATACHDDHDAPGPPPAAARRTVLVYMAAHNSLGAYGRHLADSVEMMAGRQYIDDADRLLVFVDDGAAPRLYRYSRNDDRPHLLRSWPREASSVSSALLGEVVATVRDLCPAESYGLVLWSHADGWLPPTSGAAGLPPRRVGARPFSFGIDDEGHPYGSDDGAQMDIDAMADALTRTGVHFDYVFFDACLMQNIEVAYALRGVADYVVAAPMSIAACGANYTSQLRHGLFADTPAAIVETYVTDVSDPEQQRQYDGYGLTIAAVRTGALDPLADILREALPHSAAAGHRSADMAGALNYQAYTSIYFYRPHNYDAADALRRLLPEPWRSQALAALGGAVAAKATTGRFYIGPGPWTFQTVDEATYSGVSLFVPQQVYADNASATPHGNLNDAFRRTEWYDAAGWAATGW